MENEHPLQTLLCYFLLNFWCIFLVLKLISFYSLCFFQLWWPPSPDYWWPPSPEDDDQMSDYEDEDYEDYEDEDSDDQHRQHNAFWKGFCAAIKGYASESEEDEEGEEEDDEGGVHRDRWNVKEDQNQDEHEQEDDGRPYSRSRTPRCSSRCKYYPCDRPIRSPRSSSPVVGPYRASELVESHLLESDYDSDAESDYVDIPVPPRS